MDGHVQLEAEFSSQVVPLGIDVSKAKLDCTLLLDSTRLRSRSKSLPNSAAGFVQLIEWVQRQAQVSTAEVVAATQARYQELFVRLTGGE